MVKTTALLLFLASFLVLKPLAFGNEHFRPIHEQELPEGTKQNKLVKVIGAKVAWADYAALRRDFNDLRPLTNEQINHWITENFGYISEEQLKLNHIRHTEIPVDHAQTKIAFRPPDYGRAAVLKAGSAGLIDIKGIGHAEGSTKIQKQVDLYQQIQDDGSKLDQMRVSDHSDGLMSLGEAIAETTRQKAAQRLMDLYKAHEKNETGTPMETVESYFILSLPFEILKNNGTKIPAGLYARQAHMYRDTRLNIPKSIYTDVDGNMQSTAMKSAIDFGGVLIRDSRMQNNYEDPAGAQFNNPQNSKPWAWGHGTAYAFFYEGRNLEVFKHVSDMLSPLDREWNQLAIAKELHQLEVPVAKSKYAALDLNHQLLQAIPNPLYAEGLIAYLGRIKMNEQNISLIQAATQSENPKIRLAAIKTFHSEFPLKLNQNNFDLIEKLLNDKNEDVRVETVKALRGQSTKQAYDLYRKALNDSAYWVRYTTINTISLQTTTESVKILTEAARNSDSTIADQAKKKLLQLSVTSTTNDSSAGKSCSLVF